MTEPIEVTIQGVPVVEDARVVYENDTVVLIEIDIQTKYCRPVAHSIQDGTPGVVLWPIVDLNSAATTEVIFPNRKGMEVFCTGADERYMVRVCLEKREP